jgi:hypothetical protein
MNDPERSYYFQLSHLGSDSRKSKYSNNIEGLPQTDIDLLLSIVGREALREKRPNLQELEQIIMSLLEQENAGKESKNGQDADGNENGEKEENTHDRGMPFPIIRKLLQEGYLKDNEKWLTSRGFSR